MSNVTPEQLHYLRSVLGVRSFIRATDVVAVASEVGVEEPVAPKAVLSDAKLLALFPLAPEDFPLRGEMAELVGKMIKAMKLDKREVLIAEWIAPTLPDGVLAELEQAALAQRPVVVFGHAPGFLAAPGSQGEWWSHLGARLIGTHAARELLASPAKKKDSWAHLQMVMRELGLF